MIYFEKNKNPILFQEWPRSKKNPSINRGALEAHIKACHNGEIDPECRACKEIRKKHLTGKKDSGSI